LERQVIREVSDEEGGLDGEQRKPLGSKRVADFERSGSHLRTVERRAFVSHLSPCRWEDSLLRPAVTLEEGAGRGALRIVPTGFLQDEA